MKQIITLFFVLSSFIVNAQENLKYLGSKDDAEEKLSVFLLTNTVKESSFGNGKYLEAWIKAIEIKKVTNVMTTAIVKYIVDCKNSRFKILNITKYNSNGQLIKSLDYDEYQDFEHASPGSVGYEIINAICDN